MMYKILFFIHYIIGGIYMKYENVPNIISGKDLDYLSDMFSWNYGVYKSSFNASNNVEDTEVKIILNKASDTFYGIMNEILNILGGQI